jgi:polyisoprenoid-binding protein YceI
MKYVLIFSFVAVVFLLIYLGQQNSAPEDSNTTETQSETASNITGEPSSGESIPSGLYTLVSSESEVEWIAEKSQIVGYTHYGTFPIQSGTITISPEDTVSGTITLDMTNLTVASLGGGKAGNESTLEKHLKTGDFFEVETYPTALFTITDSTEAEDGNYTVNGDLTIKNQTHPVTVTLTVSPNDDGYSLQGETEIDRTRWGITFGSNNFFENLAENAINDIVKIKLDLVVTS